MLVERDLDRPLERVELPLALGGRPLPEVRVAGPEVDVGGMEEAQHPALVAPDLAAGVAKGPTSGPTDTSASWCERGAPVDLARLIVVSGGSVTPRVTR